MRRIRMYIAEDSHVSTNGINALCSTRSGLAVGVLSKEVLRDSISSLPPELPEVSLDSDFAAEILSG